VKKIIVILNALLVAGCASNSTVKSSESVDSKNIVSVRLEDIGIWKNDDELFTEIHAVYDSKGNTVAKRTFFNGISDPLKLPLGSYQFVIKCANTNGTAGAGVYNFNRVNIVFSQPENYVAYCIYSAEKGVLGLDMINAMRAFISPESQFKEKKDENRQNMQSR